MTFLRMVFPFLWRRAVERVRTLRGRCPVCGGRGFRQLPKIISGGVFSFKVCARDFTTFDYHNITPPREEETE